VILDIEPIAYIQALAVDRQGLVMECVDDHQRDELLREMIGSIVIGTTADGYRESVCPVIGKDQKIRGSLGAAVGTAGMDRCLLSKKQVRSVDGKISVNLIRRDLMIARNAVLSAGINERRSADDVGLQEDLRILDRAVYMSLRRKIDDDIRFFLLKKTLYALTVTDIQFDKSKSRMIHNRCKGGKIACVGQLIHTDDTVFRMFLHLVKHKVASNKSSSSGHNNSHFISFLFHYKSGIVYML
jgi:hypothetical protein